LARQLALLADKDAAGNRSISALLRQGGADNLNATLHGLSLGTYAYFPDTYDINPITGLAWTFADLSACEAGQEVTV
jgi:hypothetical protein